MHHRSRCVASAVLAALLAVVALAGSAIAADKHVTMYASKYLPAGSTRINAGDTVTWVNDDDLPHDAVGNGWGTKLLFQYDSASVTFRRAGTYNYHCSIHPEMTGRVIVRAVGGGAGLTDPPTDTVDIPAPVPSRPSAVAVGLVVVGLGGLVLVVRRGLRPR